MHAFMYVSKFQTKFKPRAAKSIRMRLASYMMLVWLRYESGFNRKKVVFFIRF